MSSIQRGCSSCGTQNAAGATFCQLCGSVLPADPARTPSSQSASPATSDSEAGSTGHTGERAQAVAFIHEAPTRPHYSYGQGSVLGSYRLMKQIGAGGMGQVFVAEHIRLGRKVAVKILRPEYTGNQEAVKRFFAEARAVNRINHENIIEISDFIEGDTGPSFYIMELLEGVDLRGLGSGAPGLMLSRAVRIAIQVASGLGAAHEAGIIHRDLKPENIFLVERQGRKDFVKLLDFGVAKLANAKLEEAGSFKSIDGVVVGTPEYMAPEQALGETVDFRADIYSFGVILFEMITGRPPFKAESAREHMAKHIMATPPRPSRLRAEARDFPALEELILACLEKEPTARPQRMKDVERRLQQLLEIMPDGTEAGRASQSGARRRWIWTGVGAAISIAIGSVLAYITGHPSSPSGEGLPRTAGMTPGTAQQETAPRSAPPPFPERVVPATVRIAFDSTPSGAAVVREGSNQPLGVTPLVASFPSSPETAVFEFHLDGWRVEKTSLPLTADAQVKSTLVPLEQRTARASGKAGRRSSPGREAEPAPPDPAPKPPKLDHDIVLNPFE